MGVIRDIKQSWEDAKSLRHETAVQEMLLNIEHQL